MNIENIDCDSKSKVLSLAVFELLINCILLNFCSDSFPHKHIHDNDNPVRENRIRFRWNERQIGSIPWCSIHKILISLVRKINWKQTQSAFLLLLSAPSVALKMGENKQQIRHVAPFHLINSFHSSQEKITQIYGNWI